MITTTRASVPVDPIGTDLSRVLRTLKLSGPKDALPLTASRGGPGVNSRRSCDHGLLA